MIYLDNCATTRVFDEALEVCNIYMKEKYFNPSGLYRLSKKTEEDIDSARKVIADVIHANPSEIYFAPSATMANNMLLLSILSKNDKKNIVTTYTEHSSVFKTIKSFKEKREIRYVKINEDGSLDLDDLKNKVDENTGLVSIMQVQNEIGVINNLEEIGKIVRDKSNAIFHVDGVQGFIKYPINVKKIGIDLYTISAHKVHGPKGIAGLFVDSKLKLQEFFHGGGQEKGYFPGTENVAGIMGFKKAVEIYTENRDEVVDRVKAFKEAYIRAWKIEESSINSYGGSDFIVSASFKDIRSEVLIHYLENYDICVSSGSSCSKNNRSRVLEAIKLSDDFIDGTIRISFSYFTNEEEINEFLVKLKEGVETLRSMVRR